MLVGKVRLPVLVSLLLLVCICNPFPGKTLSQAQTTAEEQIRGVLDTFFRALEKKDIDGLMALWSDKAQQAATGRQSFTETFGRVSGIELKRLAVKELEFDGDKVTARVVVEINATDTKTGKPAAGFGELNRTLRLAKDDRAWRVFEYQPSEKLLALSIVNAKTAAAQQALLDAHRDLVTVQLEFFLTQEGIGLYRGGQYSSSLDTFRLVADIARGI